MTKSTRKGIVLWLFLLTGALSYPLDVVYRKKSRRSHVSRAFRLRGGDQHTDSLVLDTTADEAASASANDEGHAPFVASTDASTSSRSRFFRHMDAIHPLKLHLNAKKSIEHLKLQFLESNMMMSMLTPNELGLLTARQIYALALLGSSCGFYLFLYFITVGYALGIALPILFALILGNTNHSIPFWTNLQASLIVVWGLRSAGYFIHREYVNWPQLHEKVVQVDEMARFSSKLFCWLVYPLFYGSMMTPCLARLEQAAKSNNVQWGTVGRSGVLLQLLGFLMETIADHQKSAFKSEPGNRHAWCNVGLWRFSTHPNYLGEQLFWIGTFVSGLGALHTTGQWFSAVNGLMFITAVLSGARKSLGAKHWRKYGNDEEFVEFRRTHWILGPIPFAKADENRVSVL